MSQGWSLTGYAVPRRQKEWKQDVRELGNQARRQPGNVAGVDLKEFYRQLSLFIESLKESKKSLRL